MTISGKFIGSDQAIILSDPDGRGSYVIPADSITYWAWGMNVSATIAEVTCFEDNHTRIYPDNVLRDVQGTINFGATTVQHCTGHIDPDEPIIKEYSVCDMLQMIQAKLLER